MTKINVNGKEYLLTGNSISISGNGNIIVDGEKIDTKDSKIINVSIEGTVQELKMESGVINIKGNVTNISNNCGDIEIEGNVYGSVHTVSGDIECGRVEGTVYTVSGDIRTFNK